MQTIKFVLCVDGHGTRDADGSGKCSHPGCTAAVKAAFDVPTAK